LQKLIDDCIPIKFKTQDGKVEVIEWKKKPDNIESRDDLILLGDDKKDEL
jgi:hypothetical protein